MIVHNFFVNVKKSTIEFNIINFIRSQHDHTFLCDCQKKVRSNKKNIVVSSQNDRTFFCDCQKKVRSNLKFLFL